jgi:hypothetical protein
VLQAVTISLRTEQSLLVCFSFYLLTELPPHWPAAYRRQLNEIGIYHVCSCNKQLNCKHLLLHTIFCKGENCIPAAADLRIVVPPIEPTLTWLAISAITRSQAYLAVVADAEDGHGRRPHSSCTGSVRPAAKPVSGGSIYTRPVDGVRHAICFAAGCSGSLHLRLERSCIVVPDPPKLAAQLPDAPLMGSIRRRRQYSRISRPPAMAAGLLGWLAAGLLGWQPGF